MRSKDLLDALAGALAQGLAAFGGPALVPLAVEQSRIPIFFKVLARVIGARKITVRADLVNDVKRQGLFIHHQPLHKPLDVVDHLVAHHNLFERVAAPAFQIAHVVHQLRAGQGFQQQ